MTGRRVDASGAFQGRGKNLISIKKNEGDQEGSRKGEKAKLGKKEGQRTYWIAQKGKDID